MPKEETLAFACLQQYLGDTHRGVGRDRGGRAGGLVVGGGGLWWLLPRHARIGKPR